MNNQKNINDRSRKKEIQLLSGPNEYNEFTSRLKTIIQYHKRNFIGENANVIS